MTLVEKFHQHDKLLEFLSVKLGDALYSDIKCCETDASYFHFSPQLPGSLELNLMVNDHDSIKPDGLNFMKLIRHTLSYVFPNSFEKERDKGKRRKQVYFEKRAWHATYFINQNIGLVSLGDTQNNCGLKQKCITIWLQQSQAGTMTTGKRNPSFLSFYSPVSMLSWTTCFEKRGHHASSQPWGEGNMEGTPLGTQDLIVTHISSTHICQPKLDHMIIPNCKGSQDIQSFRRTCPAKDQEFYYYRRKGEYIWEDICQFLQHPPSQMCFSAHDCRFTLTPSFQCSLPAAIRVLPILECCYGTPLFTNHP